MLDAPSLCVSHALLVIACSLLKTTKSKVLLSLSSPAPDKGNRRASPACVCLELGTIHFGLLASTLLSCTAEDTTLGSQPTQALSAFGAPKAKLNEMFL
jgi:hypothetical protein